MMAKMLKGFDSRKLFAPVLLFQVNLSISKRFSLSLFLSYHRRKSERQKDEQKERVEFFFSFFRDFFFTFLGKISVDLYSKAPDTQKILPTYSILSTSQSISILSEKRHLSSPLIQNPSSVLQSYLTIPRIDLTWKKYIMTTACDDPAIAWVSSPESRKQALIHVLLFENFEKLKDCSK